MSNLIGKSIDRYHILEQLGEGGMAIVYKAHDTRLERDVAIKIIRTDLFGASVLERILKRFEREAKSLARLSHPNIIKVIDYGEYEGSPYLVMEYMPGGTLKQKLGKPMPWQDAVRLLIPIAEALEYAHEQKIIHRDVKPSNILLMQKGQPMLTDFGIAKILENEDAATLTGTGIGVGTPEYMAPEQWTGSATAQSDIYSLGVVLYEMVTGRKPYTADTPAAILLKQANEPLPRPKIFAQNLPDEIEKILIKALAKKPNDRYQNMSEFVVALVKLVGGQTVSIVQNAQTRSDYTQATVDQFTGSFDTQATIDQGSKLPKPTQEARDGRDKIYPRWRAVLWIALIWAISFVIYRATNFQSIYVIVGAIRGFAIALVLRRERILSSWRNVLWITLGWATGFAIGSTFGWTFSGWTIADAIASAIGGFITALVLRREKIISSWENVFWITIGWATGLVIGGVIANAIIDVLSDAYDYIIVLVIGIATAYAIGGAIGGAIMIWRLRKESKP